MKKKRKTPDVDELIERFVETINRLPREPGFEDAVPPSVRGEPEDPEAWYVSYDWSIRPWPGIDWIEPLEDRLGLRLPSAYRSLVIHYAFPSFTAGPLWLFANTPEGAKTEFRDKVFADPAFVEVLLPQGYIPFAQPELPNYDQFCFDTRRQKGAGECPIVRIDHERVLCDGVIGETVEVAPSFAAFVEEFVRSHAAPVAGSFMARRPPLAPAT